MLNRKNADTLRGQTKSKRKLFGAFVRLLSDKINDWIEKLITSSINIHTYIHILYQTRLPDKAL